MTCLPDLLWDSNEHSPSASEPAFLDLVYDELHRMASSLLRHERPAHTLQTSALVNEAFLRLSAAHSLRVEDRQHFLRIAARSMRPIPGGFTPSRPTESRCGMERRDLDACQTELIFTERTEDYLALDAALHRLAKMDARQAQ